MNNMDNLSSRKKLYSLSSRDDNTQLTSSRGGNPQSSSSRGCGSNRGDPDRDTLGILWIATLVLVAQVRNDNSILYTYLCRVGYR